ncbi:MAG: o-succinylbenzoate--CoA ligase [Syntrophomonadaceae bacterium]|nr:o-succinylbenzoate--CoA ligase [Syntrophomonadaceae bacterium]
MPNWLSKRALLTPERIALRAGDHAWTFAELNQRSQRTAQRLAQFGIKKDDHVALLVQNSLQSVEIFHALEYLGAVMVLLNTRLTPYELAWQLQDASAVCLIYDHDYQELTTKIKLHDPGLQIVSTTELLKLHGISVPLSHEFTLDHVHSIIYTSGTTGHPKGVMLTYGNYWWSAVASAINLGLNVNDCWLLCLPVFHVGGLSIVIRGVIYGITVEIHPQFDPVKINESIRQGRVTMISVVSVMLTKMLQELGHASYPTSLRCVLLGGGPVPRTLLEQGEQRNIPLFQTYGMTETASQIATLGPDYLRLKPGSAGKALFPFRLKIIKGGIEQMPGEEGEIVVKGPNVTKGYYRKQAETENVIRDGWLYTGDWGYLDEDGFLYLLDRREDLIISGGENIYPAEVESVILKHPAVEEAGVAGREDQKWGQVPVAFVKLKTGEQVKKEDLFLFCRQRLAGYKVPIAFYFVNELPRNATNKLLRRRLLDLLPLKDG